MREILFRGKRTDNGEWVEGYYEAGYVEEVGLVHYIWALDHNEQMGELFYIYPETVGQFAGITDANGKKIFEGDIVKTHYANTANKADFIEEVVFRGCKFCAMAKLSGGGRMFITLFDGTPHVSADKTFYMDRVEVIGNIHDNPELLNEREDHE